MANPVTGFVQYRLPNDSEQVVPFTHLQPIKFRDVLDPSVESGRNHSLTPTFGLSLDYV